MKNFKVLLALLVVLLHWGLNANELFERHGLEITFIDTIDFDELDQGQIVDDEYDFLGVEIFAFNLGGGPDLAVIFDSNNPTGGDFDLGAPFLPAETGFSLNSFNSFELAKKGKKNKRRGKKGKGGKGGKGDQGDSCPIDDDLGDAYPNNILIIQENDDCDGDFCVEPDDEGSRPGGVIVVFFETATRFMSMDVFDIELTETESENAEVIFYDDNFNVITSEFLPNTGDNAWTRMEFDVENVSIMEIYMPGSGAIDSLVFESETDPCACFPFIHSSPREYTVYDKSFEYQVEASDAVEYRLAKAPNGLVIDANTGLVSWQTTSKKLSKAKKSVRKSFKSDKRYRKAKRKMKRNRVASLAAPSFTREEVIIEAVSASGKITKQRFFLDVSQ